MTQIKIVGVHPFAQLLPSLPGNEFAELVESIALNGLLLPIVCDPNGLLLDGRNRLKPPTKTATIAPRILQRTTTAVTLRPQIVQQRDITESEPEPARMEDDPIEQWLVDWPRKELATRLIEADRRSPGYARGLIDDIRERLPPTMH